MVRKLIKPLLSIVLMAPAAALALGLGEVKLHSALNQNLNADIELLSVEPGDMEELEISMASAETFAKLGLNRPAVLMFVKFEVKQGTNGKYYVNATSKDAIREPFLDFLVEAKWPAGRVLREYTLLLDPPTRHSEMAAPVNSTTTGGQKMASPTPQPTQMNRPQAATSAPMQQQEAVTYYPSQPAAQPGGVSYGPVQAGDTLWQIALKLRPNRNISAPQMMMALLKANPHAFVDNNINRLKKGFVLRVDDPALYSAMSKAEAARAVSQQTREWQDYREAVAAKAGERQNVNADAGTSRSTASGKSEPKLKLVAPNGKQKSAGAGAGSDAADADAQEQLMLALESSAAQRKENEELQGRVDDLEAQLTDMQRLLALKDSDMATLQKQLREQGNAVSLPSEQAPKPETPVTPRPEETAQATDAEQAKADKGKPAEIAEAAETAKSAAAKPEPKPKTKPKPRVMPQPQPEPSFIDMLLEDELMMMAGGGVIVLLLLLGLVISRRRNKGGFQESILSGGTSSMLSAGDDDNRGETSFLSDLAISGMGGGSISADEGEVDPITEADVFMAYGRYQQAEEVLKKALEAHPNRPDVTAKLFEVYFNTREKDKFDGLVDSSASSVQENDEAWASVVAMGKEISPENPLFATAEASAPTAPAPRPEPISDDVLDIGLDLDELSAEMEGEADSGDSLDLGLDIGDLDDSSTAEATPAESGVADDLDFDLDFGDESADASPAPAAEELSESNDLDFDLGEIGADDLDDAGTDLEVDSDSTLAATDESEGLGDLDLGDLDFGDLSDSSGDESQDIASLDLSDLDAGDDDFNDLATDSDTQAATTDDSDVFSGDEISTKLDLAQAYIEMGDGEGARSMLDEVVVQGNAQQKQQAESLLSRI